MNVREFKTVDEVHQIWNDETWIRYHTIRNQMGMVDLTEEQEEELFPDVPDYIVVDGKVYEPDVASHLENYGRQVDGCSFFRIKLEEVDDQEILNEVYAHLRKDVREQQKEDTENWLESLMEDHPWIKENNLVLVVDYEGGEIKDVQLTTANKVIAIIDCSEPDTYDVEGWLQRLSSQVAFITWLAEENLDIVKPIDLNLTTTAIATFTYPYDKPCSVTLRKAKDFHFVDVSIKFAIDDKLTFAINPTTEVQCTGESFVIEHTSVPIGTPIKPMVEEGIRRALANLNKYKEAPDTVISEQ